MIEKYFRFRKYYRFPLKKFTLIDFLQHASSSNIFQIKTILMNIQDKEKQIYIRFKFIGKFQV